MSSKRVQRQVDRLLDQAEEAIALRQWEELRATCETLLSLDPDNSDAARYMKLANDSLATDVVPVSSDVIEPSPVVSPEPEVDTSPPVAPQDAEPDEDGLDMIPSDARMSGSQVRDLMVVNAKLALEKSETPEERHSRETQKQHAASRRSRESSRRQVREQVRRKLNQATSRSLGHKASRAGLSYSDKSRVLAGILGIILGGIGVHRFYLGNIGIGILQILVSVFTLGIGSVWGFIEGIIILAGGEWRDGDDLPLRPHGE